LLKKSYEEKIIVTKHIYHYKFLKLQLGLPNS